MKVRIGIVGQFQNLPAGIHGISLSAQVSSIIFQPLTAPFKKLRREIEMPRVLIFAPCDRVIFGIGDQSASLIMILHGLQLQGEATPAIVPILYRFSVFVQWYKSADDEGKIFEQKVSLALGDTNPVLENVTSFQMTTNLHRIVANFQKLPALTPGEYNLTLSIRMQGEAEWSQPIASYPVNIMEAPKPQIQPLVQ